MTKPIIFETSYLITGIMCSLEGGCGTSIESFLRQQFQSLKEQKKLPADAELSIYTVAGDLGVHRLSLIIESEDTDFDYGDLRKEFAEDDICGFDILDESKTNEPRKTNRSNWYNIGLSISATLLLIGLSFIPACWPLTLALTVVSFGVTAYTGRKYFSEFATGLANGSINNMAAPISAGWLLSLGHAIYHGTMPVSGDFSMVFMSYIMPVLLMTLINAMDEIKRFILGKSADIHLKNQQKLEPQTEENYLCYPLTPDITEFLDRQILNAKQSAQTADLNQGAADVTRLLDRLEAESALECSRKTLKKNMIIRIRRGEHFPADAIILKGTTLIDPGILTGEPRQNMTFPQEVPSGAVNLGQEVLVYTTATPYNSTFNKLMFRSNRSHDPITKESTRPWFAYLYAALIIVGIAASLLIPVSLGLFSISLLINNLTGILFSVCTCTLVMAHELPKLLSNYQRYNKGIFIRDKNLLEQTNPIHTFVFDKTGTLTTGNSQVHSLENISQALLQRIHLLEKHHGANHPVARAIIRYYENNYGNTLLDEVKQVSADSNGLTGLVQGRQICIGSREYFEQNAIQIPDQAFRNEKTAQGYTAVCVAEDGLYAGTIYIKHQPRPGIINQLKRLRAQGKRIIMLTGDTEAAAHHFNLQNGSVFKQEDIYAGQKPLDKEQKLVELLKTKPEGVCFTGDGLNDGPSASMVVEEGGISCAMDSTDKVASFTSLSLNGNLDYLFVHEELNNFTSKTVLQNQSLIIASTLAFLAFYICFSIAGIGVPSLIPVIIMTVTTLITLFNSYRVKLAVDVALDKASSLFKQALVSDFSIALLAAAGLTLMLSVLLPTMAIGGLSLPIFTFAAGTLMSISTVCLMLTIAMAATFILVGAGYLIMDYFTEPEADVNPEFTALQVPVYSRRFPELNEAQQEPNPQNSFQNHHGETAQQMIISSA